MGYMTDGLTFNTLRRGNLKRLPMFKSKDGQPLHAVSDGSDWTPAQWFQALIGELGEYANLRKKVERGDFALEEARPKLAEELADAVIYLDLLAAQLGIDLGKATIEKWNAKSEQLGMPIYIDAEDWHFTRAMPSTEPPATPVTHGHPAECTCPCAVCETGTSHCHRGAMGCG